MKLTGDQEGITALKELVADHRDYLKFLITEAQSNSDHATRFKAKDGRHWELKLHLDSGNLEIRSLG